ncbi:MAG: hypothetical protein ACRD4Y_05900, partial [Candidatus Acidiferrales bacterium]
PFLFEQPEQPDCLRTAPLFEPRRLCQKPGRSVRAGKRGPPVSRFARQEMYNAALSSHEFKFNFNPADANTLF